MPYKDPEVGKKKQERNRQHYVDNKERILASVKVSGAAHRMALKVDVLTHYGDVYKRQQTIL